MSGSTPIHPKILRLKEVVNRIGLSRSTIYDRINPDSARYDRTFPKPIKIGRAAVGWLESSVNEWIESLNDNVKF
ncbi:AlpA family transcriptional regulator [Pseudomonas monteilii]|uniref:AlpA family transcriptional regulator n=1 Tax=Pseudomonas monteilii TaxID=76759 RepID=A0A7X3JTK0_9PSED|nr:AlpA family transcriptional regulator [Pseudomonas monteilii]